MVKFLILLFTLFSAAHCGVREPTPEEESMALQLFEKYCLQEMIGPEGTQDGSTHYYCKLSKDTLTDVVNHKLEVPSSEKQNGQVLFVQPPPIKYTHNIDISGGSVPQAEPAKIFVLPQKNTHEIKSNYNGGQAPLLAKPQVYFIKKVAGPESNSQSSSSAGAQPDEIMRMKTGEKQSPDLNYYSANGGNSANISSPVDISGTVSSMNDNNSKANNATCVGTSCTPTPASTMQMPTGGFGNKLNAGSNNPSQSVGSSSNTPYRYAVRFL